MDIKEILINSGIVIAILGGIGMILKSSIIKIIETYIDTKFSGFKSNQEAHAKVLEGFLNNCHNLAKEFPAAMGKVIAMMRDFNHNEKVAQEEIVELRTQVAFLEDLLHGSKLMLTDKVYWEVHEFKEEAFKFTKLFDPSKESVSLEEKEKILEFLEKKRKSSLKNLELWAEKLPGIKDMT